MGSVFVYAGFSKLLEPIENFRGIIAQYEVIPYIFVGPIAVMMPWIEFIGGALLIAGYLPRQTAMMLGFLSLGFLVVLGSSHLLLGNAPMNCGCFGENSWIKLSVRQVFLLDITNLAAGFYLYSKKDHLFSLDSVLKK